MKQNWRVMYVFDWMKEHWFLMAPVGVGMLWVIRWLFGHSRRHETMEAYCRKSDVDGKVNKADHVLLHKKADAAIHGIKELLVHFDLKRPGEPINGEDI